jgi:integrase
LPRIDLDRNHRAKALGLTWRDIDFNAGTLRISGQLGTEGERVAVKSTASAATVPLLPALARELQAHRFRDHAPGENFIRKP